MKSSSGRNRKSDRGRRAGLRQRSIMLGALGPILFSGCLYLHTRPAGLEPQAKTSGGLNYTVIGESEAQSSSFNLLWLLPVTPRISYGEAVSRAIDDKKGDDLIEVRTWIERQIWILGMVEILHVRGTVIRYEK